MDNMQNTPIEPNSTSVLANLATNDKDLVTRNLAKEILWLHDQNTETKLHLYQWEEMNFSMALTGVVGVVSGGIFKRPHLISSGAVTVAASLFFNPNRRNDVKKYWTSFKSNTLDLVWKK
jgi:hypothetical protein